MGNIDRLCEMVRKRRYAIVKFKISEASVSNWISKLFITKIKLKYVLFIFTGHCVVDQTEKGWFVQYIDRDPETIRRQTEMAKKEKMELDDEERTAKFIKVSLDTKQKHQKYYRTINIEHRVIT